MYCIYLADIPGLGVGHFELGDGVDHGHAGVPGPHRAALLPQVGPALGTHVLTSDTITILTWRLENPGSRAQSFSLSLH